MIAHNDKALPAGNVFDKYHSRNPFHKYATNRFLQTMDSLIRSLEDAKTILEAGCGDGYLLSRTKEYGKFARLEGIDISKRIIERAKMLHPSLRFSEGSLYNLEYPDKEFDLVLACEVLEHLENYRKALSEIRRVGRFYCVISVPLEPLWRILNVARGKYVFSLGNTPGHVQHWDRNGFSSLLKQYFQVVQIRYPLPWQMALCKIR